MNLNNYKVVDIFQDGPFVQLVLVNLYDESDVFKSPLKNFIAFEDVDINKYLKQNLHFSEIKIDDIDNLGNDNQSFPIAWISASYREIEIAKYLVAGGFGKPVDPNEQARLFSEYFPDLKQKKAKDAEKLNGPVRIGPGTEMLMQTTYIENGPLSFYLQPDPENPYLKKVITLLNSGELPPFNASQLAKARYCAANLKNMWCRAEVVKVTGDLCKLFLLDYGINQDTNISALKQMPKQLEVFEPFAKRFCLEDADKIPKDGYKFFSSIIQNQLLRVKVTKYITEEKLYICLVFIDKYNIIDLVQAKMLKEIPEYEKIQVSLHCDYNVMISFVDSTKLPWNFYVILEDQLPKLQSLMSNMAEVCEKIPSNSQVKTTPGMPIIAKFNDDGQWYRATVLENTPTQIKVHYDDYGNNDEVKHEDTRPIRNDFISSLPTQAIACRLQSADTVEAAAFKLEEKYSNRTHIMKVLKKLDTGEFLVKLIDSFTAEDISLKLVFKRQASTVPSSVGRQALSFDLPVPPVPDHIKPLREEIVNRQPDWMRQANITLDAPGLPEQRTDPKLKGPKPPKFANLVEACQEKAKILESRNRKAENWSDEVDTPQQDIKPKYGRKQGMYSDGPEFDDTSRSGMNADRWPHDKYLEHEQTNKYIPPPRFQKKVYNEHIEKDEHFSNYRWASPAYVEDEDSILPPTPSFKKPLTNTLLAIPKAEFQFYPARISPGLKKLEVIMTYMKSPWAFSLQCIDDADKFRTMTKRIAVLVKPNASNLSIHPHELIPGNACLAKHMDNKWHRATVIELVDDNTVKVKFVDLGVISDVNVYVQVKQAPVELNDLLIQNFDCTLRGAVPKNGVSWSSQEEKIFKEFITNNKLLLADLISVDEHERYSIVLYHNGECLNIQFGAKSESLLPRSTLAELPIEPNSSHTVQISWFYTPLNFYVYLESSESNKNKIRKLLENVAKVCPVLLQVEKGNLVLARFPQNSIYFRGLVVATKEDKAKIFRYDIGDFQICDKNKLRAMSESLMDMPANAVQCRVSGIEPMQGEDWPRDVPAINTVFQSRDKFLMTVVSRDNAGKLAVDLTSLDKKYKVADELIKKSMAKKEELPENARSLKPGCTCQVFISHYNQLEFCVYRVDMVHKLEELQTQLQNLSLGEAQIETRPGKIAAAKNSEDGLWYRVLALGHSGMEGTTVVFIDYGNIDIPRNIKKLPEEFTQIPAFATNCMLAIKPPSNETDFEPAVIEMFNEFVFEDASGLITLKTYDITSENVIICDILSAKKESFIDKLVDVKLAERTYTEAYISYVESPARFYMQEASQETKMHIIEERLSKDVFEPLENKEESAICIARFEDDGELYRARVVSIIDDSIKVLFFDYGNMAIATEFKRIPMDMSVIPPLAKQCSLNVLPTKEKDITDFITNSLDGTVLYQVKLIETEKLPWKVELMTNGKNLYDVKNMEEIAYDTEIKNYTDVIISHFQSLYVFWIQRTDDEEMLQMIDTGLVKLENESTTIITLFEGLICAAKAKSNGLWYRARIQTLDPPTVNFIDYGHTGEAIEFKELTQDLINIPALAKLCSLKTVNRTYHQIVDIQNEMRKVCNIYQAEIIEKNRGITFINLYTNGKNILHLFPILKHVNKKSGTEFTVSHVVSLYEFYIHFSSQKDKLEHLAGLISNGEKFKDLESVEEGLKCLSKHPENEKWCRALVLSTSKVLLIDHGLTCNASVFKSLPEQIKSLPPMAKLCYLINIPTLQAQVKQIEDILNDSNKPVFVTDTNISKFEENMTQGINVFKDGINIIEMAEEMCDVSSCDSMESNKNSQASVHTRSKGTLSDVELSDDESTSSSHSYTIEETGMQKTAEQMQEQLENIEEEKSDGEKPDVKLNVPSVVEYDEGMEQNDEEQCHTEEKQSLDELEQQNEPDKEEEENQTKFAEEERENQEDYVDDEIVEENEIKENGSIFVSDSDEFSQEADEENKDLFIYTSITEDITTPLLEQVVSKCSDISVKSDEEIITNDAEENKSEKEEQDNSEFNLVLHTEEITQPGASHVVMPNIEQENELETEDIGEHDDSLVQTENLMKSDSFSGLEAQVRLIRLFEDEEEKIAEEKEIANRLSECLEESIALIDGEASVSFALGSDSPVISDTKDKNIMPECLEESSAFDGEASESFALVTDSPLISDTKEKHIMPECLEESSAFDGESSESFALGSDSPVISDTKQKNIMPECLEESIAFDGEASESFALVTDSPLISDTKQKNITYDEMSQHETTASKDQDEATASEETASASNNNFLELAKGILSDIDPELASKIGSDGIMEILEKLNNKITPGKKNEKKLDLVCDVSDCKDVPLPLTPDDSTNTQSSCSFNTTVNTDNSMYFSPNPPSFEVSSKGLTLKTRKHESLVQDQDKSSPDSVYGTPLGVTKTSVRSVTPRPMTPRSMIPIRKTSITPRPKSSLDDVLEASSSNVTPKSTKNKKSVIENLKKTTFKH